ncbi:MAG: NADH-quinone oxidoreductase subunit N [Thermomicrobiales bacterium]
MPDPIANPPDFHWIVILPHLIVLGLALVTLAYDIIVPDGQERDWFMTAMSVVGYGGAIVAALSLTGRHESSFVDMAVLDDLGIFLIVTLLAAALLTVFIAATTIPRMRMPLGEFYTLLAFSTLGGMFVSATTDLVMVFVGIELSSLSVFILAAFAKRRRESIEGALKYFLLSAFATAILLYGMAWLYGVTGSTNLNTIATRLTAYTDRNNVSLLLATLLIVVGLGFKAAAVPFHMWTPDAYQGAPTPVTAFMSVAPKVTAFAAIIRVLIEGMGPMREQWVPLLIVLAVLTMGLGNLVAISQRSVKRMLAYSSIAHTGYILVGIASFQAASDGETAISSVLFYNFAYTFMNLGAFAIVAWLQSKGRDDSVDDFSGLAVTAPLHAAAMAVFLFSLTGVPPLLGFYGKYFIIQAAIEANLTWLAIVVVIFSAISAFYYLRLVATMYFGEPKGEPASFPARFFGLGIAVMVVATLTLGILSGPILDLAKQWVF